MRTADDQLCSVISLRPAPAQAVYNIEVDLEHVYFVSTSGILVHNACSSDYRKMRSEGPPATFRGNNPHVHHIVFKGKWARSAKMREILAQSRAILQKHGIDIDSAKNLAWASNQKGMHTIENARAVRDKLMKADGRGKNQVVKALEELGTWFGEGAPGTP